MIFLTFYFTVNTTNEDKLPVKMGFHYRKEQVPSNVFDVSMEVIATDLILGRNQLNKQTKTF